jgi:SET domain-containing protein
MEKIDRLFRNKNIYVANSKIHGRGVFTDVDILPGEIIEQAHVVHPDDKTGRTTDPNYFKYFFFWPCLSENWKEIVDKNGTLSMDQISYPACVLGFGMIYNHSLTPNVLFEIDIENNIIEYRAKRKILAQEELLICYNMTLNFNEQHRKDNNVAS